MKLQPNISILTGFLFLFDIDYPHPESVAEFICLADVNDCSDLSRVFDLVVKPDFFNYSEADRCWLIETLTFFLNKNESFEEVLEKRSFLFSDEIEDGRLFMGTLLGRLRAYQQEMIEG